MKKLLCIILTLVMALGCMPLAVSAADTEAEGSAQFEIAPYIYKSVLYPMEFPSLQSYEIKEKSNEGDYAISSRLNDLSYTVTVPAGTTEIMCRLSLDGEVWRGVIINSTEHSTYWPKDEAGKVDYTKPVTFRRDSELAERDEYGIVYRDYLRNTDAKGFKNYDKIYWKVTYICNGTEFNNYFEQKLYDYDSSEKQLVKAVNFNVAGLPFGIFSGEDVAANQSVAAEFLSQNGFDIVAVQEDFDHHQQLADGMNGYNYKTNFTGGIPGGDGLNLFTKNMPVYNEKRVEWNDACGILSDGSDELTPKGFMYTVIDIGNGIYVDFYNLHADAYGGAGSVAARTSQFRQLAEFIEARSAENDRPVIITGDFNYLFHSREDNDSLYNTLCADLGFKDAWVEFHNGGDYFNMHKWHISGLDAWGNWDSVERFMYRPGGGVDITVSDFRYTPVTDGSGKTVSDHSAAECDFEFIKTSDFKENTQELQVITSSTNNIIHKLIWIMKVLMMVFSDLGNLSSLLGELG